MDYHIYIYMNVTIISPQNEQRLILSSHIQVAQQIKCNAIDQLRDKELFSAVLVKQHSTFQCNAIEMKDCMRL